MGACPSCGKEVELGRLTGILGMVCRSCDAYNEPGVKVCAACGKPLGSQPAEPPPPAAPVSPPSPAGPLFTPAVGGTPPPVAGAAQARPKSAAATRFVPS